MKGLKGFNLQFENQTGYYKGKVREVFYFGDKIAIVASDRISAFDHILPRAIPYKGQVLNGIATHFLNASRDIVPNWLESTPHPNVCIGLNCETIKLEMVVRGYLAGHAWREYSSGKRKICGVDMPNGMAESDKFPKPIITPATKAEEGHDEDISEFDILDQEIVSKEVWEKLKEYSLNLFELGTKMAQERGLILVDTKYEFGLHKGEIYLIDEIHTPDSSRYYIAKGYAERQSKGEHQKQLSKEFVREWLMSHNFQGKDGDVMPVMPDEFMNQVTDRYIELYEIITGKHFPKGTYDGLESEIKESILSSLSRTS